jgi:hypothetical protein
MAQREKRTLFSVHQEEVRGLYGMFLASQDMADDDVFSPAYAPASDFCSTVLQQVHLPIRNILYSRVVRSLQAKLQLLKFSPAIGAYMLPLGALSGGLEVLQVFFSSGLLLIPIDILLFGKLDKEAMFGVVVASVFVFCAVLVLGRGGSSGQGNGFLHGVLVTFLAQLGT